MAQLIQKVYEIGSLTYPKYRGQMGIIASIGDDLESKVPLSTSFLYSGSDYVMILQVFLKLLIDGFTSARNATVKLMDTVLFALLL